MRRKSALAALAVAACFAVGASALAQNSAKPDQIVYLPTSLTLYSPAALQGPLGNVSPSLLSSETRALIAGHAPLRDLETSAAVAPGIALTVGSGVDLMGRYNGLGTRSANDGLFLTSTVAP